MYAACLFCHRSLGGNDVIASFPVGRQLAFDGARGRLWVVCPHCARWNLTPLEERWEALEEAERRFRAARVRAATDEIALARVRGGLTLVRVGKAPARELTAWRYGRELARRLWRTAGLAAGGTVAIGAAAAGAAAAGLGGVRPELIVPFLHPAIAILALQAGGLGLSLRPVRVPGPDGRVYEVFRSEFEGLYLEPTEGVPGWRLRLKHGYGVLALDGDDAVGALRPLLARINRRGALRSRALDAARWIEEHGGAASAVEMLARASRQRGGDYEARRRAYESGEAIERDPFAKNELPGNVGAVHRMPAVERLALEVAVVEDAERRAMEEELAPLARAWQEAEAIAVIADRLALPDAVERRATGLRDALAPRRPRD